MIIQYISPDLLGGGVRKMAVLLMLSSVADR